MGNINCCDGKGGNGIAVRYDKQVFDVKGNIHEPIRQIKSRIAQLRRVSPNSIILCYNGSILSESQTLQQLNYDMSKDQLILSIKSEGVELSMQVTIRNISFTQKIQIKSTQKIKQLKKKIDKKNSIPVSSQRLIYNGTILNDDEQVGAYGIHQGSVIHLTMVLKQ